MRRRTHNVAGFLLLEAMVATLILGLVLSAILAVASQSMRHMNDIRLRARSSEILQRKMEDIRLLDWSEVQTR